MSKSKLLREYDAIVKAALEGAKKMDVYTVLRLNSTSKYTFRWQGGAVYDVNQSDISGAGLYCFTKSGHLGFGATNKLDVATVSKLLQDTAKVARSNEEKGADTAKEIFELAYQDNLGEDDLHYVVQDPASIKQSEIESFAHELEKYVLSKRPDAKPMVTFTSEQVQWRIVRSDNTDVDFAIPYTRGGVIFTIRKGEKSTTAHISLFRPLAKDLLSDIDKAKQLIDQELLLAEEQLDASAAEGGNLPVLVAGNLAGTLVHEALGHPAESDAIAENASVLGSKDNKMLIGKQVAARGVTIRDHEEGLNHGYHPYGAFGNQRKAITIIEDGILKESISDIFTGKKIGVANKNAERSEHYGAVAIPRMSTTYIELHKDLLIAEKLPSSDPTKVWGLLKEKGIFDRHPKIYYLIGFRAGQVAAKTGDFMFGAGYTYELTADKVTPKQPMSFSGSVLEALKAIEFGVGELQTDDFGNCGKAGQVAYVSDGGHELVFFGPTKHVSIA